MIAEIISLVLSAVYNFLYNQGLDSAFYCQLLEIYFITLTRSTVQVLGFIVIKRARDSMYGI